MSESRWDRRALRAGASVSLTFAVPLSVAARLVAGDGDPQGGRATIAVLLSFGAAVGFFLGALVESRFGLKPWLSIGGLILGFVAGGRQTWLIYRRYQREEEERSKRP